MSGTCRRCDQPRARYATYCEPCRLVRKREDKQAQRRADPNRSSLTNHRKRARFYGVEYEPVQPIKVFTRDRWICGICRDPVDKTLRHPDPMSPSLDHVIPLALGGGHTYANTQAAHLICNSRKSHHGTGDQLALIG